MERFAACVLLITCCGIAMIPVSALLWELPSSCLVTWFITDELQLAKQSRRQQILKMAGYWNKKIAIER